MAGTPSAEHPRAFVRSGEDAVAELVTVLDDFRPHLVVTYDPDGGYGHPDHIRAHEAVHAALEEADHRPRRVAWTVTDRSDLAARHPDPPAHLRHPEEGELPSFPDSRHTHRVRLDAAAFSSKVQALGEHATQLELACTADERVAFFALTNGVLQPVVDVEWYVAHDLRADGARYVRCPAGVAHLLDGLAGDEPGEGRS